MMEKGKEYEFLYNVQRRERTRMIGRLGKQLNMMGMRPQAIPPAIEYPESEDERDMPELALTRREYGLTPSYEESTQQYSGSETTEEGREDTNRGYKDALEEYTHPRNYIHRIGAANVIQLNNEQKKVVRQALRQYLSPRHHDLIPVVVRRRDKGKYQGQQPGDDPRLQQVHPRHGNVAWIDCYDDNCPVHKTDKKKYGVQMRRTKRVIATPYERDDIQHYAIRYQVNGTNIAILKRVTPEDPRLCENLATIKACPWEGCQKHGQIKAQLWHEQQLMKAKCGTTYAVNCEDDGCQRHGNEKFHIRSLVTQMKEEGFDFKTRRGSKSHERAYALLLSDVQMNLGECRAMIGPLCRRLQCLQHPNEGLFESKNY
jgi:hypothetical protein